jgi:hypothetical protein
LTPLAPALLFHYRIGSKESASAKGSGKTVVLSHARVGFRSYLSRPAAKIRNSPAPEKFAKFAIFANFNIFDPFMHLTLNAPTEFRMRH